MTTKTGNFKSFNVFINMLENAINQVKETNFYINLFNLISIEKFISKY